MKINQARMLHTVFHHASFIWISSIYSRLVLPLQILHPSPKCLNFDEKEHDGVYCLRNQSQTTKQPRLKFELRTSEELGKYTLLYCYLELFLVANMIAENSLKVFHFHSSCHLFRLHMRMSGVLHLTMIWGSHVFMVITVHDEDHPGDWSRCY
ncbi:uncharacterized protein LOC133700731 [Populus nigra]|uniref:uncharacterized protein LOC133700731 n=1 Tax=Populus nigra TaxID=3691 RepID=UPI002B26B58C|nr:uncharacterized protein LOC133700731 [Populus nigra]